MEVLKKNVHFIVLTLFYIVFLTIYWGRFGDPVIDCGREAYIPYAMGYLDKILFKDIICIYGPVPYYLNTVFLKIFGASLNVVWGIGAVLSYIFLFGYFKLAKHLLGASLAFRVSALILFCCILSSSISNFIFPYSFAIVYALLFAVFHLYFLVKFIDNKKGLYLYLSSALLSFCVLSKLDFLPCIIVLPVLMIIYRKNISIKQIIFSAVSFTVPFLAIFIIFLLQKVTLSDLIFNFKMISNMAHSPSLQYFYSVCTGYFFDFKKTFMFISQFAGVLTTCVIAAVAGVLASKIKNSFFKALAQLVMVSLAAFILYTYFFRYIFIYLPLLLAFFVIIKVLLYLIKRARKVSTAHLDTVCVKYYTVIIFSILFSLKSLFGLFHELYGTFYIPFVLLSFVVMTLLFSEKHKNTVILSWRSILTAITMLFFLYNFIYFLGVKNSPVKTYAGTFYTTANAADYLNMALKFLDKNLSLNDTLASLPEGLLFNFVLKKEYPYFNTSFTPLDFDAYGEDYLTEEFLNKPSKYLLLLSRHYGDYGKSLICSDFGNRLCSKIHNIYTSKVIIAPHAARNFNSVQIFERKY